MIKKIFSSRIYKIKSKKKLDIFCKKKSYLYLNYVLHYLLIIEDYERINQIIEERISKVKRKKYREILNYYWCIYFINKDEKYSADKIYTRLNEKNKIKIDILKCNSNTQQLKIFDDNFGNKLNSIKVNKNYNNLIDILYLLNLFRQDKIISKLLELKIKLKLNFILFKHTLGINDIEFISTVVDITNLYYSLNAEHKYVFPVSKLILKKIVYKLIDNINLYNEVLGKSIITYNEKVCLGLRTLLSIDENVSNQKLYVQDLNDFISKNQVEEYTKFIFEVSSKKSLSEKEDISIYIEEIKKIVDEEISGDIIHIIFMCCSLIKEEKLLEFYEKLKEIQYNGDNNVIKDSLVLGTNLLRFWIGEKISLSFLTSNVFISEFLKLLILIDNGEIAYDEFLKKLNNIDYIEVYSVFSWKKMDSIFKKYNFDWLKLILEKVEPNEIDYKFKNHLLNLYVKLLNHKMHVFYNEFDSINKLIILKNKEISFKVYSAVTLLSVYNLYDNDVKELVSSILNMQDKIDVSIDILESFILSVIVFVYRNKDKINTKHIRRLINSKITGNKRVLFLIGLYFIDFKQLSYDEYDQFLYAIYKIYIESSIKDVVEFSMLSHIANNIIVEKKNLYDNCIDVIYSDNGNLFVLESDYVNDYDFLYKSLDVKKVKCVSALANKDTIMTNLICKIYFSNIEKYGAGKLIQISSELKGKELMEALLKEMGYEETQEQIKKIKQGEFVNSLWLNEFSLHTYMKDIKSKVDKKFANSFNDICALDKKIIHVTSLVLLAKLGIIQKIVDSKNYFCTGVVFNEFSKMNEKNSYDLIDGVVEDAICYDDYTMSINKVLKELKEKNQIEYVSSANILGIDIVDRFNKYDVEFIKLGTSFNSNNLFSIITEEPFYFKTDFFKNISYGTYSLIIDMLKNKTISCLEFSQITEELEKINYNLKISGEAYKYLLSKSSDENILKVIKILNKYNY